MSMALERSNSGGDHRIERSGFAHCNMSCAAPPIYNSGDFTPADRRFSEAQHIFLEDTSGSLSSSSTSSIGKNSDDSTGGGGSGDEQEVQSECKESPLNNLDALEEVLPIKSGRRIHRVCDIS